MLHARLDLWEKKEQKIEQSEKQEKRIHTDMEQTVKQAGYPDVQSFAKTYQK